MRPDAETNNAFVYCLAIAAQRFGIRVLFTVAMSNHHHTGIRDPLGNYPAFLEHFHKLFAKCQNSLRGRWENFWAAEHTSMVRLVSPEDALDKLVYALTNPVKDHLVEHARQWPGASSLDAQLHARALRAHRPKHFFRENGPMPPEATLHVERPEGFEHLSQKAWVRLLVERIEAVECTARAERRQAGIRVLGERGVLEQRWQDHPKTREPRRKLSPRVAASNKWARIEALRMNRDFQRAYAEARDAFTLGLGNVLFPEGTYWLRLFAGVLCGAPVPFG